MLACFTRGSGLERRGSKRQRTCRPQKEWGYDSLIYPTPGTTISTRRVHDVQPFPATPERATWRSFFLEPSHFAFSFTFLRRDHRCSFSLPRSLSIRPRRSTEEEEQVSNQFSVLKERLGTR